jgi:hypothetical protein
MRLVDWGVISKARAAGLLTWFEQNTDVSADDNAPDLRPVMSGLAIGTKNGRPASVGVSLKSPATQETEADNIGMGAITGIPLACGIKFLADGQLHKPGVLSPESRHIEPKAFLSEVLIQLGKIANFSSTAFDDHIEIARSW